MGLLQMGATLGFFVFFFLGGGGGSFGAFGLRGLMRWKVRSRESKETKDPFLLKKAPIWLNAYILGCSPQNKQSVLGIKGEHLNLSSPRKGHPGLKPQALYPKPSR